MIIWPLYGETLNIFNYIRYILGGKIVNHIVQESSSCKTGVLWRSPSTVQRITQGQNLSDFAKIEKMTMFPKQGMFFLDPERHTKKS